MLARYLNTLYPVVEETEETVTIAWHQTTYYKTHEFGRTIKHTWYKPGCGEDFEQIDELIGVEDYS